MACKSLSSELKEHIPFTMGGAATGIVLMFFFDRFFSVSGEKLFIVFHPMHVVLSAFATTMLYRLRAPESSILKLIIIGYIGSIGVATVSDCVIPYCGERLMGISVPAHGNDDHHDAAGAHDDHEEAALVEEETHAEMEAEHAGQRHIPGMPDIHIGFIEEWKTVNSAAVIGIILGIFFTAGKLPHTSHVLISTWASMAHIMMNTAGPLTAVNYIGIFVVLFLAVWLPCCLSDIVFPTLFSMKVEEGTCCH